MAAGGNDTFFLKTDGTLWGVGSNASGELGDGTTTSRSTPVQVATGVASISAVNGNTAIVKTDGTLWATGQNGSGQLGDGTTTGRNTFEQMDSGVASLTTWGYYTLYVKTDGTLWAVGLNNVGQLGDGTTTDRSTPVQVATGVAAAFTGYASQPSSLFLKTDGTLWAMGQNTNGQLGDGTTTNRSTPVQVAAGVAKVALGSSHSMILKTDGTLWTTGQNTNGQLGDGTTTDRSTPVQVASGVSAIDTRGNFSLFLKTDGTLWGMGQNTNGQLGDGTTINRSTPAQITSGVAATSANFGYDMFIKTDGTLWGVGTDGSGELGDGTVNPARALLTSDVVTASLGATTALYVKSDGTLWSQPGGQVPGVSGVVAVSVGAYDWVRLYLKGDGTLWQLKADNTSVQLASGVASGQAGLSYAVWLKTDGTLWGQELHNQDGFIHFGDGTGPVQVDSNVLSVSAAGWHILYVKGDHTLWGQGQPWNGWNDTPYASWTIYQSTPLQLDTGIAFAVANSSHNLYVRSDGTLWTRGAGWSSFSGPAVQVDTNVVAAAAIGGVYSTYIKGDGTLWLQTGILGTLPAPVQLAGGALAVSGGTDAGDLFIQQAGYGTAPAVTTQPLSASHALGDTVTLHVAASGTGPMDYQWFKDGVAITNGRNADYTIGYMTAADVGSYTVTVTNSAGSVTSAAAALNPASNPLPILINFEDYTSGAGQLVTNPFSGFTGYTYSSSVTLGGIAGDPIQGILATSALGTGQAAYFGGAGTNLPLPVSDTFFSATVYSGPSTEIPANLIGSATPVRTVSVDFLIQRNGGDNQQALAFYFYDAVDASDDNTFAFHSFVRVNPDNTVSIADNNYNYFTPSTPVTLLPGVGYRLVLSVNYNSATWSATINAIDGSASYTVADHRSINVNGYTLSGWTTVDTVDIEMDAVASASHKALADRFLLDNLQIVGSTPGPTIGTFTTAQSVTAGGSAIFQVTSGNATGYQWQRSTDNGATWTTVTDGGAFSGASTSTLNVSGVNIGMNGWLFRTVASNADGSTTSTAATLTVSLAVGAGVETIDPGFTRPQFRRAALPGRITADQVSGSGKIYATFNNGASVTSANNQRIGAVIRLNANGTLDSSFNTGSFLTDAWAVVPMANGQVLVGGLASSENYESGVPLYRIFRFNLDGTRDPGYNSPVISGIPRYMTLQPDGKLLVAPSNQWPNSGLTNLIRLNTDGSLDGGFTVPTFDGGASVNEVFATILVDTNNKILVGGYFSSVNGTNYPGVARLNSDGTLDGSFSPNGSFTLSTPGRQVRGLGLQTQGANAGKILVAGAKIQVGGVVRAVVRLNSNGTLDGTFNLQAVGAVIGANGLRPRLLNVLPNDQFTIVSDSITRFNADGTLDGSYTRPAFSLESFWMDTLADGSVLVPPEYGTTVNGAGVGGPFKLTPGGAVDGTFTPPAFQTEVYPGDFAIRPDGKVLIWGNFDTVNTTARHGMALLNSDGSLDPFNLSGVANLYSIQGAALLGTGQILAATNLGSYSGLSAVAQVLLTNGVSRFSSDGSVDGTFTLDPSVNPGALHPLPDGRQLTWDTTTGTLLNAGPLLQRLTLSGSIDGTYAGLSSTAFGTIYRNPANSNRITSIVQGYFEVVGHYPDGRALAVATTPNGPYPAGATTLNYTVLRINTDGTLDSSFTAPSAPVATSSGYTISLVDPQNQTDGPVQFSLTTAGSPPFSGVVPQADGSVIVYGSFSSLGGNPAPGVARLTNTGAFDAGFSVGTGPALSTPAGRSPQVSGLTVAPDGKTWITGLFDSFSGVPAPGIVRLNADGSVDTALATQIAYRSYLGNGTKVAFGLTGEIYVLGTYAQPIEPFPLALHRLVGTVAPVITCDPKSQSVSVGANVTFSVTVTPGLTVAYQWFKGGVAIPGATNSTYSLTNVQPADAASYTVVITNAVNFATSNAAVLSIGGTFAAWQSAKFTSGELGNPGVSGPNAVYGQDGLTNLLKYALGLEPKQNITTGLPAVTSSGGNWVYTYVRPTAVTDVTYTVQYSTDLANWTNLADSSVGVSGGMDTRQVTFSQTTAPNIFFRLSVSTIPPT